jgi:Transposase C of IS166 homeodomain
VSESTDQLPTDIAALQAMLTATRAERDAAIAERNVAIAERDQALSQNHRLQHLLHQLQRMQFGKRSEKLNPDQLLWHSRTLSKPLRQTKPRTTRRIPRRPRRAPRSADVIVARLAPICRAFM